MLTSNMIGSIWSPWRNKRGATATITKMVPRQHIGSGSSRRYRCKRNGRERVTQGWWGAPGFRARTVRWHGNEEEHGMTTRKRCNHEHLLQHTCIRSRTSSQGYTFEACISGRFEFNEGSCGTRVVVEVVVHVSKRNLTDSNPFGVVVVLAVSATVVGRSGTYVEDELDESKVDGSGTHVVGSTTMVVVHVT